MLKRKLEISSATIDASKSSNEENPEDERSSVTTSHFFPSSTQPFWRRLYEIEIRLNANLRLLKHSTEVSAVYNPTEYATLLHCRYLERFLTGQKRILFLGMNPGPWGMCQTGVPFGHIPSVRDWMRLNAAVAIPQHQLGGPPISGLACEREEQSGKRFWGTFREICGDSADTFFRNCFVHNYCPLAFFHSGGKNITPSELKGDYKTSLQESCSESLVSVIALLQPKTIISVGRYTSDRVKILIRSGQIPESTEHLYLNHPSPRSRNSNNWPETTKKWLIENHIIEYLRS